MKDVYIVDALRTAVGSFGGTLTNVSAVDIAVPVVKEILKKNSLEGKDVDEVLFGNVLQAGAGQNVARQVQLYSDIPVEKNCPDTEYGLCFRFKFCSSFCSND